jgi:hypothetical protein
MMPTRVLLTYDTNENSRALTSYRLDIATTTERVTDRLVQTGPVFNGLVVYAGVFETERDALIAVLDYVQAPGYRVVRHDDQTCSLVSMRARPGSGCTTLATRFPNGSMFIA